MDNILFYMKAFVNNSNNKTLMLSCGREPNLASDVLVYVKYIGFYFFANSPVIGSYSFSSFHL